MSQNIAVGVQHGIQLDVVRERRDLPAHVVDLRLVECGIRVHNAADAGAAVAARSHPILLSLQPDVEAAGGRRASR